MNISSVEENFILDMLKSNNVQMQEFALNSILLWDNISDIEELKNVYIANRYLQDDLDSFIQQKA